MEIEFTDVRLSKPRTTVEKDKDSKDGVIAVTTMSFDVNEVNPEVLRELARHVHYGTPLTITVAAPRDDLLQRAQREAEEIVASQEGSTEEALSQEGSGF